MNRVHKAFTTAEKGLYCKSSLKKHCITYLKTLVVIVNIRPKGFFDCPVRHGDIQVIKSFVKCLTKCSS